MTYQHAYEEWERWTSAVRALDVTGGNPDIEERILNSVPMGLYEHFKSKEGAPMLYLVRSVSIEVDTNLPRVNYYSLYGKRAGNEANRPLISAIDGNGFLTPIDRAEYRGIRFKKLYDLNRDEFYRVLDKVDLLQEHKGRDDQIAHILWLLKRTPFKRGA